MPLSEVGVKAHVRAVVGDGQDVAAGVPAVRVTSDKCRVIGDAQAQHAGFDIVGVRHHVAVAVAFLPQLACGVILIPRAGRGHAVGQLHHVGKPVHHVILIPRLDCVSKALQPGHGAVGQVADRIESVGKCLKG